MFAERPKKSRARPVAYEGAVQDRTGILDGKGGVKVDVTRGSGESDDSRNLLPWAKLSKPEVQAPVPRISPDSQDRGGNEVDSRIHPLAGAPMAVLLCEVPEHPRGRSVSSSSAEGGSSSTTSRHPSASSSRVSRAWLSCRVFYLPYRATPTSLPPRRTCPSPLGRL